MRTLRKSKENALTAIKVSAEAARRPAPNVRRCSVCMVAHNANLGRTPKQSEPFVLSECFEEGGPRLRLKGRKVNRYLYLCLAETFVGNERVSDRLLYFCVPCFGHLTHCLEEDRDIPLCVWCLKSCKGKTKYRLNRETAGFCRLKCLESYRVRSKFYKGPLATCVKCHRCWEPGSGLAKYETERSGSPVNACDECNESIRNAFLTFDDALDLWPSVEGSVPAEEQSEEVPEANEKQGDAPSPIEEEEEEKGVVQEEGRRNLFVRTFNYVFGWTGIRV